MSEPVLPDVRLSRRGFVGLAAAAAATAALPTRLVAAERRAAATSAPAAAFELEEKTIAELQAGMQRGQYTAVGLTEQYLARIDALDRRGPMLRAVLETNTDARAI